MTRLALLADLHYSDSVHDRLVPELEAAATAFEEEIRPDGVVVLGDVVHETDAAAPDAKAADRSNAATVDSILDGLDCPVRYVPGNHDAVNLTPADAWPDVFGHDPWTVDVDESLVFLDSSAPHLPGAGGEVSADQLRELRAALSDLSDGLAFVHHPVYEPDVRGNRWFEDRPAEAGCKNGETVRDVLASSDAVVATFSGHLHEAAHVRRRGVDHFTVDAFNKELEPTASFGAYAVVDRAEDLTVRLVDGDGRETAYRRSL